MVVIAVVWLEMGSGGVAKQLPKKQLKIKALKSRQPYNRPYWELV
jgi:hypothetical protein